MAEFNDATGQLLDRREFTSTAILALPSGVTITVMGCGDSDTPSSPRPTPSDRTGSVTANHGHQAVLTGAQLNAGNSVTPGEVLTIPIPSSSRWRTSGRSPPASAYRRCRRPIRRRHSERTITP